MEGLVEIINQGELLNSIFQIKDDPLVFCTFNTVTKKFEKVGESCLNFWGYTAEEMKGTDYEIYCVPEDLKKSNDTVNENAKGDKPIGTFENRYFHKDGSIVHNLWIFTSPNKYGICLCIALKYNK